MTRPTVEVVTCGEVMALLLAEGTTPLSSARRFDRSVAGSEGNVAVALARLGHTVSLIGRVGLDAPGAWVRGTLRGEGVDVTHLRDDSRRPTCLLLRDAPSGRPITVLYHRSGSAGSALAARDICTDAVATARIVFVTALTAALSASAWQAVEALIVTARRHAVPVVFDPNVRLRLRPPAQWRAIVDELLPAADVVLAGHDDLRALDLSVDELVAAPNRIVVVKDGKDGATVHSNDGQVRVRSRPVPVVDSVGAGDAFAAGWICATLHNASLERKLEVATTVASAAVAARGDLDGLPDAPTLSRMMDDSTPDVDR